MDWPNRWDHLQKVLNRAGPFAHPDFTPGPEVSNFLFNTCRILVVGAGGLGCELLKNLALMGFRNIDVIDMDTIELSNLNRQFLFRPADIGKPKADVAAAFINKRIAGCKVVPHFKKIQDYDETFYRQFHIIVCGLDSLVARRWINAMVVSISTEGIEDSSIIPVVDGGTEGFKGNIRLIIPGMTSCVECTLDYYPPQVNFPLCTIAHTPRLPEHCIEYVKVLLWPKEKEGVTLDCDDPEHVNWIYERALERASEFNIEGVTYRLTQGVIKNIVPAVATTNAVIAASCATEVFKLATSSFNSINNYMVFNSGTGLYTYTFESEKKDDCMVCSQEIQSLTFSEEDKLQTLIDFLVNSAKYQMRSPGITASVNGANKTLYMQTVRSIEERTKPNLSKSLKDLGLTDGQVIVVADVSSPNSLMFQLELKTPINES